ncbi:MAG: NAD(P)H-binding protein [Candidatus Saccharibacteria bacterium]|nr:NAD(P)H-binding protein [Pseudorhodobacter sp.]
MKVIVFGATGGTGRAVTKRALAAGHSVTAFVRDTGKMSPAPGLRIIQGDAMVAGDVAAALVGQEAVVITLGNSQNAFGLLFGARRTTPRDVCAVGTHNILSGLSPGIQVPLIVVSAFGIGETRDKLPFMFKLFYRLFLREQMADKEKQEAVLKASGAAHVIVQPVALTDKAPTGIWTATRDGTLGQSDVSRGDLAGFLLSVLESGSQSGETISFSGKPPFRAAT